MNRKNRGLSLVVPGMVIAAALGLAGCGEGKRYDNVSANGEVSAPSAPVGKTVEIPPHKRFKNVQEACPPLPVKDGFVTVKMKVQGGGDITLRLPEYADIKRHPAMYGECKYATDIFIHYVWFKGRLVPGWGARFDIPGDKDRRVRVTLQPESTVLLKNRKALDLWRYTPAIPHRFLPLEYYPRYHWETETDPGHRSNNAGTWGVTNTKHRTLDDKPFPTWCAIETSNINGDNKNLVIESDLLEGGGHKCSGGVTIELQGRVVAASIDVYKDTVPEINRIYDAVYEEVQHFIQ